VEDPAGQAPANPVYRRCKLNLTDHSLACDGGWFIPFAGEWRSTADHVRVRQERNDCDSPSPQQPWQKPCQRP
jgi:hypothetical protein